MAWVRRFGFSSRKRALFFTRMLCRHVFFALTLLLYAALPLQSAQAARQMPVQIQDVLPCKSFLEWMLDPNGTLSIQEISAPERQKAFASLDMRFPPHQSGTLWLRFTLGPRPLASNPATLLLDMGDGVPGTPLLFAPKNNVFIGTAEWRDIQPSRQSIFLLPDAQGAPLTMYIRLEGLPGPWFAPMLRTPHNAATALERMIHPAILVALGVVMLLCLLRGLTERGQWRIWTSLYTGASLAYAAYGMPVAPGGVVPMHELPGVLAPGIALMLLPHVGRHLMQTRDRARSLDIQYVLLSLPGAALALLPIVPGFAWTSYYLALWPLAAVLFVPTSLGAWLSGLPGARRFLLACLMSMIGATVGILGMYAFVSSPLLQAGPLLGVTLGALLIAGTAIPRDYELEAERNATKAREALDLEASGLRLLPPEEIAAPPADPPPQPPTPAQPLSVRDAESHSALEGSLRPHLDTVLRESAGIALCALPPAARRHAEAIANSGRAMTVLLHNSAPDMALDRSPAHTVFDLQQLLRGAHDQLAEEAERKGLRISWFMPPHLPQYYSGNAKGVGQVIRLLLESAIRATRQGFVQLTVRRVPESVNPGHLLFSINDSGSGMPPHARSSLALARTWELAGAQGGSMSAESGAQGTTISFTLQLKPQPAPQLEADVTAQAGRIVIVDELSSNRQLLAFFLEALPCAVEEARTVEEAVHTCQTERAALLLIDCDMPETQHLDALKNFLAQEHEQELPATPVLAIESEGGAWAGLNGLENVHRLVKPVSRSSLREKVLELLPQHLVPSMPGTEYTRYEGSAQDAELPLDLASPVEYGPGLVLGGGQFMPLSLDHALSPPPAAAMAAAPETVPTRAHSATTPRFDVARGTASAPAGSVSPQAPERQPTPFPGFPPEMEWLDNPTPATQMQDHAPLLQPFDRQTTQPTGPEDFMADMAYPPSSLPNPRQGGLLHWIDSAHVAQTLPHPPAHTAGWSGTARPGRHAPEHAAPSALYGAHAPYEHQAAVSYHDAAEWVGEPMPVTQTQNHASLVRPFDRQAVEAGDFMEDTAQQPSSLPDSQQDGVLDWIDGARAAQAMPQPPVHTGSARPGRYAQEQSAPPTVYEAHPQYAYHAMEEWVGEPTPVPRAEATPVSRPAAPRRPYTTAKKSYIDDFIPLRLTHAPQASPPTITPLPELSAKPTPLSPKDSSLLRLVLGRSGEDVKTTAPPPSGIVRAARELINFVRTGTDGRSLQRGTPHAAQAAAGRQQEQPENAAMERPPDLPPSSAVEQMQPLIPELLSSLDEAMVDVRRGFNKADTIAVEEAAARIAARADNYGLRTLARMARCVESAAKARDKDALANILPDLETAVERSRIELQPQK